MKLALVISSLSRGGAERVMAQLANEWARRGDTVTLVTFEAQTDESYALDPRVRLVALGLAGESATLAAGLRANFRRMAAVRRTIAAAGAKVVLSFEDQTNVVVLLATVGLSLRRVIAERTDPRRHRIGGAWRLLRRLTYPFADVLAVQSEALLDWGRGVMLGGRRVAVVANPVRPMDRYVRNPGRNPLPTAVAVGRLVPSKGFDLLLTAFASLAAEFPAWNLVILGEGDERRRLEDLARHLGIADRVTMPGWQAEPGEILETAGFFVLSSRYEGFPNVLLESMACAVPAVATKCCGVADIITHEVDGLIVPVDSAERLAGAMRRMMDDSGLRSRLGANALRVSERYQLGAVVEKWTDILAARCDSPAALRSFS